MAFDATEGFRHWLTRNMTGCVYAGHIASKPKGYTWHVLERAVRATSLNALLDAEEQAAIVLSPRSASPADVASLLRALRRSDRWQATDVSTASDVERALVRIDLKWRRADGGFASVVGFGPLRCMPISRRAPYVALAMWTGPHANDIVKASEPVSVAGVRLRLPPALAKKLKSNTKERVDKMVAFEDDDRRLLRRTTFLLPRGVAGRALGGSR